MVFLWALVELVYFSVTGDYILYYHWAKRSITEPAEYLAFINSIYNVQPQTAAITFTNDVFPGATIISLLLCLYDIFKIGEYKKSVVYLILDVIPLIFSTAVYLF